MIGFRVRHSESWLSAQFGPVAAAQLRDRLLERCEGEKGLFLTLTYRRDEYDDPQQLYQAASRDRHVRGFIRRLSRKMGEKLTGRWLVKLEFQQGGWVHWHMLLLGCEFLNHTMLTDCWGHGFVWVKRMTPGNIAYTCKYVSKDGELPAFLYMERSRSVRIVRVSPGFWRNAPKARRVDRSEVKPWYRSVGEVLESSEGRVVLRDAESGRYLKNAFEPFEVLTWISMHAAKCEGYRDGFLWFSGITEGDFDRCGVVRTPAASAAGRRAAKPPALHLNTTGDPHPGLTPGGKWFGRYLEFELGWRDVGGAQ